MAHIKGMTLIELLISIGIMAVLSAMALPLAENEITGLKERELRSILIKIRGAIDRYYSMKNIEKADLPEADKFPKSLFELEEKKLIRKIPIDPFTGKSEWRLISSTDPKDSMSTDGRNVFDIRSMALGHARDKTLYGDW